MISDREDADAYDAALSRLLDGLDVPEATDSAEAAANAAAADDVAKIARALRMIGAEAAGEPAVAGSAAADVAATGAGAGVGFGAAAGSGVDARLVPFRPEPLRAVPAPAVSEPALLDDVPSITPWWRKPSARVLTAAASVAVIALGVAVGQGAGSNGDSGAVAQQAPAAAESSNEALLGQGLSNGERANAPTGTAATAAGAAAVGTAAAAADTGAAAADTGAAAAPAATTAKASKAAARKAQPFASVVKCARAIVVGEVTGVGAAKVAPRATWTFAVSEWVSPSSGAGSATYVVGDRQARMPDGKFRTLAAGTSGLFLVPADRSDVLYAWTGDDVVDGRKKIDAALAKGSSASC